MVQQIILFLAGLSFLIFSLLKLSAGIQRIFSVRIRHYLKKIVRRPIQGVWLGAVITALFQSSSATMVLVVGLVSAGLISFFNSLGIILGAGIGTTVTLQLVVLKVTDISPLFIIAGVLLWLTGKDKRKAVGEAVFYFGLLFFSLFLMGQTFAPLRQSQSFVNLLQSAGNPLLAVLISFIFTAIVQASSIITSLSILLAQQGLITTETGVLFVLGASVGTTATAILASIGSGRNAKRTALSYFVFRFLTVVVILLFLPHFIRLLKTLSPNVGQQIVNAYLVETILSVIIFLPILRFFSKLIKKVIKSEEKILPLWAEYLDGRLLLSPKESMKAVKKELHRGVLLLQKMFSKAEDLTSEFHFVKLRDIIYLELVLDSLQKEVMKFLDKVPKEKLGEREAIKLVRYSAIVDDIERIGDRIMNLAKLTEYKTEEGVEFSQEGKEEIGELGRKINENINDLIALLGRGETQKANDIIKREEEIREMAGRAKKRHLERFCQRECSVADGPIFNGILINFERISDDCAKIADYYKNK